MQNGISEKQKYILNIRRPFKEEDSFESTSFGEADCDTDQCLVVVAKVRERLSTVSKSSRNTEV